MLFQITHICLTEPDYVTLHPFMNMMTEKSLKMTRNGTIMVLSY